MLGRNVVSEKFRILIPRRERTYGDDTTGGDVVRSSGLLPFTLSELLMTARPSELVAMVFKKKKDHDVGPPKDTTTVARNKITLIPQIPHPKTRTDSNQ